MATALAAVKGRAAAMVFDDPDLTTGQQQVAAFLHALGCDRTSVQAVLECPVERVADLHALAQAPVWTLDVRMPVAVALGLSDHPAVLTGYGPIGADEARALLPQADLVRACVDGATGEVLAVDRPVRAATWQRQDTSRARALRSELLRMATVAGTVQDLTGDGYVPSEALGRLVDLRDVTSCFPGDSTPARRTDRDHRLPSRWVRPPSGTCRTSVDDGIAPSTRVGARVCFRTEQSSGPPRTAVSQAAASTSASRSARRRHASRRAPRSRRFPTTADPGLPPFTSHPPFSNLPDTMVVVGRP
jgi:hypothetical protein